MRTIEQLRDLSGRKALVTGAAGHVGLAVCESLMELGAAVVVMDVEQAACQKRASELSERFPGAQVSALACDLTDEMASRQAVRQAIATMNGLDIVVHGAAYVGANQVPGWSVPFEEQTVKAWDTAMRVNLTSVFILVQEAQQALKASGHGSVILIGSVYGMVGPDWRLYEQTSMANPLAYGASKGGLLQVAKYLATLLAPQVRVNVVSPGGIVRQQPESFRQRYIARTPLGRMAMEEDLKGAVAYLASDLSGYVTGQNLAVDGGWTTW